MVLVTGASSGIGLSLAQEYARRGARVAILARRLERMAEIADPIGARAIRCDVDVEGDVERAVEGVVGELGRIDVAIANAGISVAGRIEKLTLDDYRRQMETNVFGVVRTVKAVLGPLRASRGRLALVGSVNGFMAMPGWSAYVMSKFAVRGLAETLAFELAADGISVTHVAPGFVESELRLKRNDGSVPDGARDPIPRWLVMPGSVAAEQIADAIEARRREAVITGHGKLATLLERYTPGLMRAFIGAASSRMKTLSARRG